MPKATRSTLDNHFRAYLAEGGFPESQGAAVRDRASLLRTYVDVAILRDVIERHRVSNSAALRWLQRHLLGNPAGKFSVQKFFDALKSQGLPLAKKPCTTRCRRAILCPNHCAGNLPSHGCWGGFCAPAGRRRPSLFPE